jgi:hypothetical protein
MVPIDSAKIDKKWRINKYNRDWVILLSQV